MDRPSLKFEQMSEEKTPTFKTENDVTVTYSIFRSIIYPVVCLLLLPVRPPIFSWNIFKPFVHTFENEIIGQEGNIVNGSNRSYQKSCLLLCFDCFVMRASSMDEVFVLNVQSANTIALDYFQSSKNVISYQLHKCSNDISQKRPHNFMTIKK